MKIKKLNEDIIIPTKANEGDAGFDIYSPINGLIAPSERLQIKLGLSCEVPNDEYIRMSERSGQAIKYGIKSIGNIIDAGYRGEISIILHNLGKETYYFLKGDRIGQMIIHKLGNQNLEVVQELSESQRGENAHYSSGK